MIGELDNIILIGMPGSGKTTLGTRLAGMLGWKFMDSDHLVTERTGKIPRQIVEESGRESFLKIQDEVILDINCKNCVIATGGGLVHSSTAMNHLKRLGFVIYLKTDYSIIESRMDASRKLVRTKGTLHDLYLEREPLYNKYADAVLNCDTTDIQILCSRIMEEIKQKN